MDQIKELVKSIWLPIIFLLIIILVFLKINKITGENLTSSFWGVLIGVLLGFIAEILRENIKEFQTKRRDRKIYLNLLKEDAKNIHHTVWLYKRFINDPHILEEMKRQIPPLLDLKYWSQLSKDSNFLRMGIDDPFDKIFKIMWELEKVNNQIIKAQAGEKQAYQFAYGFYKVIIAEQDTEKLLLNFMKEDDISNLEKEWLNIKTKIG